ncbi:tetratricopeptide repeat protein [Flavobacterium filum]|uniref:tetratricopeptide repeat protein n=1 Tax=Flavobacterium filum TaxID=370974 RepID=UPI0023F1A506|nr:tetratricopeptide repeat protein [Flavobacterium filum]
MKDALNSKINDYCNYVNLAVKNFKEQNYPDSALNARKSAESACKIIIYNTFNFKLAEDKITGKSLKELIYQLIKDGKTERKVINNIESLQIIGNKAAHDNSVTKAEAGYTLNALSLLTDYLFDEHLKIRKPSILNLNFESVKEVELITPQIIKEVIIQEKIVQEKIDKEKEEELFSKIKDLEQRTESEKGKYEDLKNDLDKARQELKAFSETKKENETKLEAETIKAKAIKKKQQVKLFAIASLLLLGLVIIISYYFYKKQTHTINSTDILLIKSKDTIYVAVNNLQILQDNPNIDFKIESILQQEIELKVKSTQFPIKIIKTNFSSNEIVEDSVLVSKAYKLGYDLVYFGKLFETALTDSNELHIDGYLTNPKSGVHRSKKLKFKSLTDSILIKELNDQANMPFQYYLVNSNIKSGQKDLIKIIEDLKYYSAENLCASLNIISDKKMEANDLKGALQNVNRMLTYYPNSIEYLLKKANILCYENQFDSSEVYFKKIILLDSLSATVYVHFSDLYIKQNKFKLAESLALKALKIEPKNHTAYFLLANSYFVKKDYSRAKYYSLKCFQMRNNYNKNTLILAESYAMIDGKIDSAKYYYSVCIGKDSSNVEALNGLASLYRDLPQYKTQALYLFNKARNLSKESNLRNDYGLGMNAFDNGNFEGAILFLEKFYAKEKGYTQVLTVLSQSYYFTGNIEKAFKYSKEAILLDSTEFTTVYLYAFMLTKARPKLDKSIIHYFELSRKLNPTNYEMLINYLDYLYKVKQDYKTCIKICNSKELLGTTNFRIREFLANSYVSEKDFRNATPVFEYLNYMKPDNDTIMLQLSQCYLYSNSAGDVNFVKGAKLAEKALQYNPNGAFQNLVYAKYLLYGPNRNLAIERYRKAKRIDKNVFDQELERWMKILDNNEKIGLKSGN